MFIWSEFKLAIGNVIFDHNSSLWFQFSYSEITNMNTFNCDFFNFLNFWGHDPKTSTTNALAGIHKDIFYKKQED